jgi:hypothetical protein
MMPPLWKLIRPRSVAARGIRPRLKIVPAGVSALVYAEQLQPVKVAIHSANPGIEKLIRRTARSEAQFPAPSDGILRRIPACVCLGLKFVHTGTWECPDSEREHDRGAAVFLMLITFYSIDVVPTGTAVSVFCLLDTLLCAASSQEYHIVATELQSKSPSCWACTEIG